MKDGKELSEFFSNQVRFILVEYPIQIKRIFMRGEENTSIRLIYHRIVKNEPSDNNVKIDLESVNEKTSQQLISLIRSFRRKV